MGITQLLQQGGIVAVIPWLWARSLHVFDIKGSRVSTTHEAHQIRGGQKNAAVEQSHLGSFLCDQLMPPGRSDLSSALSPCSIKNLSGTLTISRQSV